MILGMIGPWQLIFLLLLVGIPLGIILITTSRAKHKSRADTLDEVIRVQNAPKKSNIEELERLTKLRDSGALTQEEFEREKRKILE